MNKRALVTLPDGVWEVIEKDLRGKLGTGDSEVIRNIVIAYLTDKGYFKPKAMTSSQEQIASELDIHDAMLTSLVDLLEEKGQINYKEWENRTKKTMAGAKAPDKKPAPKK